MINLKRNIQNLLEYHWYKKRQIVLSIMLYPLSIIFCLVTRLRCTLYSIGLFKSYKLPVPVVVIGNLNIGGVGKTPLCLYIAEELARANIICGVILRGYKGQNTQARVIHPDDKYASDEALIYACNGIKTATGSKRLAAADALLKTYPAVQIILCDDGLQHYALARDLEIVVMNTDIFSNNLSLLPEGPWRELLIRLKSVDHIVINKATYPSLLNSYHKPISIQTISLNKIYNPLSGKIYTIEELNQLNIASMAGIGQPHKFFNFLAQLGVKTKLNIAKADHYNYTKQDIPTNFDVIIVTEKDYHKLKYLDVDHILVAKITITLDSNKLLKQVKSLLEPIKI